MTSRTRTCTTTSAWAGVDRRCWNTNTNTSNNSSSTSKIMLSHTLLLLTTTRMITIVMIILMILSGPISVSSFSITTTKSTNRNNCLLSLSSSSSSSSRITYFNNNNKIENKQQQCQYCQLTVPSILSKYTTKRKTTTTSTSLLASVQDTLSVDENDNNNNNNNNTISIVDVESSSTSSIITTKKKNINFIQQYISKFGGSDTGSDTDANANAITTNKITMKDKLAKAGLSAMLSYGWVSNISYAISVSLAWFIFNKRTGVSPLLKGQWKGFLSVYFGFYIFNNIIRPVRIGISIGISPIIDIIISKIQNQLNISKRLAIVITVLLLNVIGTCTLMILGIILASILSGVPIFP